MLSGVEVLAIVKGTALFVYCLLFELADWFTKGTISHRALLHLVIQMSNSRSQVKWFIAMHTIFANEESKSRYKFHLIHGA